MNKLQVAEIFFSIQGEGMNIGMPMVFIRLIGCNLRCEFCDTKYALRGGQEIEIDDIVKEVRHYGCNKVCLTGGEPLLQDITELCFQLRGQGYWVGVETNGTIWKKAVLQSIDWVTVSPKKGRYDKRYRERASEFKYVIGGEEDLVQIDNEIDFSISVFLQPMDNDTLRARWLAEIVKREANLRPNWRVGQQYQRTLWGNRKGV